MRRSLVAGLLFVGMVATARAAGAMGIGEVKSFMYLLQNVEKPEVVEKLAASDYDMVVIEPTVSVKGNEGVDIARIVKKLHEGKKGRLVIAYMDAGQAESFRTYWGKDWKKPTRTSRGVPEFLLIPDPDGWSEDYNVAYWDARWQEVFATGDNSEVKAAMRAGFDGVYLDWIDAFGEDMTVAAAKREGVNPPKAMVDFLLVIRKAAREINPQAVVIQQNAYGLIDEDPRLVQAIDGMGVEDTWFSGKANAKWDGKNAGDIPNKGKGEDSTQGRLKQYQKYLKAGKPVFTIDYCVSQENALKVYADARGAGLVPLVTRVSLDRLTETPPVGASTTLPGVTGASKP